MSYNITSIQNEYPKSGNKYLLDTNIWYFILEGKTKPYQKAYLDFFDFIKNFTGDTKPKVVLPVLVLSEIINRLLRDIRFREFKNENPLKIAGIEDRKIYKEVYRIDEQFRIDYEMICYDIKSFHSILEFVDDDFSEFKFKDILSKPPLGLDFNDNIITKIAKKKGYSIITDDADFVVDNIPILTCNNRLIQKAQNF